MQESPLSSLAPGVTPAKATRWLRVGLPLAAAGVALFSVSATALGQPALAALGRGLVPMSPLAVLPVLLLATALLGLAWRAEATAARWLACGLAALVAVAALIFSLAHGLGHNLPLDRWLLQRWPQLQLTSLLTDLALLCLSLSLWCRWASARDPWGLRQAAALLALLPLGLGLVVLVSYAAGAPLLYGTGRIPMSIPAALCVGLLGWALLLSAGFDTWPLAAFRLKPGRRLGWQFLGFTPGALTLFLLTSVLVLTVGAALLRRQLQTARQHAQAELASIAEFKVRQLSNWHAERRADATVMAQGALLQTPLRRFLAGSPLAPPEAEVRDWLSALQEHYSYHRVIVFDAAGRPRLAVSAAGVAETDFEAPAEVQTALRSTEVRVMDLHRHPGSADIHMGFWIPIRAQALGGPAEGVMLLMVDPQQFLFPLIQSWPTRSASAESLLVRREGDDVVYLNELRHRAHTALTLRTSLVANPQLPAALAVQGREGLVAGIDYRGIPVISVLRKIPGTPWHLVAKVDEAEIFGPLRRQVWAGGLGLLGLLALVGAGLAVLLRRHDADMLRQQLALAQRFEGLMREANDIILLLDREGRILEANDRAVEAYGYELTELLGKNVLDLRAPEQRELGRGLYGQLQLGQAQRFESLHIRKSGSSFPVEVSARAVAFEGELRVISFVRDISERRAQEQELQRMNQLYAALSQVNQAIVWSPTREALFDKICQVMVDFGDFDMAWIGLMDRPTQRVLPAASYGDATGYLGRITVEFGPTLLGSGPMGLAIQEGCPHLENDFLAAIGSEPWHDAALAAGFRAMATFPIREAGQVIGALAVYSKVLDFFGVKEAALLEEAAMDISFALDHLALDEQRRGTEIALLESERLLTEAEEAGQIGTYTWFIREDRWRCSPFLERIFGIGPDHPKNLAGWTGLVAPEFRDRLQAYVARIIEQHERFDFDYPIIRPSDGATRWVHGQGDLHWDAEGQPVALAGIIQDITERKVIEQSLRKISVAVEQSPLSIVITSPAAIIEYVNPAFTRVTGYAAEEAIGQNPRILKSLGTPPEVYRAMWETLARGDIWVGEFENLKKNGELFHERATIAPLLDEAGVLINYIAFKEDITRAKQDRVERRSLEAQLHQSQKLESLGSLAGGVAHDMNNVLGAILGLASALREQADPFSPGAKSLDTIVTACMRGRGVVKSLLYFAKKDLQEERPLDLNDLVREMSQLLSHTTLKRVLLKLDLAEGLGLLRGDPGALSHVIMNLCVNAMDAMPNGGSLSLQTQASDEGGLLLRVRDTGEGMSPEVLARAMEPFFTTKPQGKGTGLGLAMVYGTMTAHDGTFELQSQPGVGTVALLRFPAHRVEALRPVEAATASALPVLQEMLRVLLVDDDELIRESVGPLLEALGHVVTTAPGGEYALQLLRSGTQVDLIILDMNMPGMSGAEALPLILALRPGLPVLMASGYSDQEIEPLLVGHPNVASLRKPFNLKELRQAITAMDRASVQDPEPSL